MAATPRKKAFFDRFKIRDRESCAKAIKNGGIAAMISAAIACVFGVAGFFTSSDDKDLNYLLDPWILPDVVLVVVLGLFVLRKSRVASTLLVVYFVGVKLLMWHELGKPTGALMTIIFFLYYATAMRGTYLWHSRYRDAIESAAQPGAQTDGPAA